MFWCERSMKTTVPRLWLLRKVNLVETLHNVRRVLSEVFTVNSRLADTSLLRTPRYYGQQQNPRRKLQTFDWNKLPLLRTLATTDLRTLYSVLTSQFYCFLSRYGGHRAASWNICTHIKVISFLLFESVFVFLVDFRFFCPSVKIPSSFALKALFAVSLSWISSLSLSKYFLPP